MNNSIGKMIDFIFLNKCHNLMSQAMIIIIDAATNYGWFPFLFSIYWIISDHLNLNTIQNLLAMLFISKERNNNNNNTKVVMATMVIVMVMVMVVVFRCDYGQTKQYWWLGWLLMMVGPLFSLDSSIKILSTCHIRDHIRKIINKHQAKCVREFSQKLLLTKTKKNIFFLDLNFNYFLFRQKKIVFFSSQFWQTKQLFFSHKHFQNNNNKNLLTISQSVSAFISLGRNIEKKTFTISFNGCSKGFS